MYVIAEAGVNHNGSLDLAKQLVHAAADAGADAVKFQAFRPDETVSASSPKAEYQLQTTPVEQSQLDMARRLELDGLAFAEIAATARDRRIEFLASPFDIASVELLTALGCRTIKIASGEITNSRLLYAAARTKCKLIVSTGVSHLSDVERALGVIAFAMLGWSDPRSDRFMMAYDEAHSLDLLANRVTLLHCTTEYPTPIEDTNLRAMSAMRDAFGIPVGFSDHTTGFTSAIAAAALGAAILEKHMTLDRNMDGPDHKASLEPAEFAEMVRSVRSVDLALGQSRKVVSPSERANGAIVRKRIEIRRAVGRGEILSEDMLATRRPADGLSAFWWFDVLGCRANRDYAPGDAIDAMVLNGGREIGEVM